MSTGELRRTCSPACLVAVDGGGDERALGRAEQGADAQPGVGQRLADLRQRHPGQVRDRDEVDALGDVAVIVPPRASRCSTAGVCVTTSPAGISSLKTCCGDGDDQPEVARGVASPGRR